MMIQPQINFCCYQLVMIHIAFRHCYNKEFFLHIFMLDRSYIG